MADEIDTQIRTRSAGQLGFVVAALLLSLLLLINLPGQTLWLENSKSFAAQPRFWPAVAIVVMVICFALHLLRMRRRGFSKLDRAELRRWVEPLEYALWFMVYVVAVPWLGFLPMSLVLACALTWRLGYQSKTYLGLAALFAVVTVILFKGLLGVKIPGAALYEILPGGLRNFAILYL
ncbi:Tripartite tricarboxylate transporter TctB family protein [Thalassovita gelatinovora]|uniref:Tripartite tricarboxylate transporter TctB family protein n=1 Tax=Thalassovita gelatinovora TaxID=53501 RepID=A0A0P1F8V7_THAGE|nr:tripartite tricarboxylate transporter TctB family protein [Thalassovita gelatinovora]QIZ81318.1 tripartite tricarboxylate transporter TctB family protein [Thalassovita gelatinovora]CUH64513.1 Tripartite tricarboxylate transporter TctB family protein [Thalassovita gelatinovora]SEP97140.1 Tripartite tricarboxylate transporter TctB family protein [Thalassovita gelatinovora]